MWRHIIHGYTDDSHLKRKPVQMGTIFQTPCSVPILMVAPSQPLQLYLFLLAAFNIQESANKLG